MRRCRALALVVAIFVVLWGTGSPAHELPTKPARTHTVDDHSALIARKIADYNTAFPGIRFVHLTGGALWHGEMVALVALLGSDSDALDYQHTPRLHKDLMDATLERLVHMLRLNVISATAFRLPRDNATGRRNLCVITLNPAQVITDDLETTRHMLNVNEALVGQIHPARYLNHIDHLAFTIDHEAFHCLDSIYNGGAPMTTEVLGGEYNVYRRESAADAFALAMHIRDRGAITPYACNITHIRALWLLDDSPGHFTFDTLREILKIDPKTLAAMPTKTVMALAQQTADRSIGSYDDYVNMRITALQATRALGLRPTAGSDAWYTRVQRPVAAAQVESLIKQYRYYYDQLFTDTELSLATPPTSTP